MYVSCTQNVCMMNISLCIMCEPNVCITIYMYHACIICVLCTCFFVSCTFSVCATFSIKRYLYLVSIQYAYQVRIMIIYLRSMCVSWLYHVRRVVYHVRIEKSNPWAVSHKDVPHQHSADGKIFRNGPLAWKIQRTHLWKKLINVPQNLNLC